LHSVYATDGTWKNRSVAGRLGREARNCAGKRILMRHLVVPPGSAHAFAAHHDSTAEALVIATPGIERFDYFRHVVRRRQGSEPPEVLLGLQDRFDTHFLDSPAWKRARPAA
jgi:hypothetical protein